MRRAAIPLLVALVVALVFAHVLIGTTSGTSVADLFAALRSGPGGDDLAVTILWRLRLPRAALALLVGANLGLVGAGFQTLFRNPLAEPYTVGASSGAALGGALVGAFGFGAGVFGLATPLAAFLGGTAVVVLVFALAGGRSSAPGPLLLAGVAVGTLASALLSLVILGSGQDSSRLLRWLLGSLSEAFWTTDALLLGVLALGYLYLVRQARRLNALSLGESAATGVGVDVERLRRNALLVGTALTATTVGAAGIIGFLGLVAPHLARLIFGSDLRRVLPAATMIGAGLLLGADILAGRGVGGSEIPVGIVCAVLGAPSLLVLLARSNRPPKLF